MMILPPFTTSESMASLTVSDEPTKSMTDQAPPLVAAGICLAASGARPVDRGNGAGLHRRFALGRVDIDHDDALAAHRFVQSDRHQPEPAGAHDDHRFVLDNRPDLLQAR